VPTICWLPWRPLRVLAVEDGYRKGTRACGFNHCLLMRALHSPVNPTEPDAPGDVSPGRHATPAVANSVHSSWMSLVLGPQRNEAVPVAEGLLNGLPGPFPLPASSQHNDHRHRCDGGENGDRQGRASSVSSPLVQNLL